LDFGLAASIKSLISNLGCVPKFSQFYGLSSE